MQFAEMMTFSPPAHEPPLSPPNPKCVSCGGLGVGRRVVHVSYFDVRYGTALLEPTYRFEICRCRIPHFDPWDQIFSRPVTPTPSEVR